MQCKHKCEYNAAHTFKRKKNPFDKKYFLNLNYVSLKENEKITIYYKI